MESTISQVLEKLGSRCNGIAGIGVSGQQHNLHPLDADDQELRTPKLWCDTSTTVQRAELTKALGGESQLVEFTGNAMVTGYTAPTILWVRQNKPRNSEKTACVLLPT